MKSSTQESKDFAKQWKEYANAWIKENFSDDKEEQNFIGYNEKDTLKEIQVDVTRAIKEYDESMFENYIIPTHEYSSKGMIELQEIIFLMEETGRIVFPEMKTRILFIMFDYYNIKYGTEGIKEILAQFINWVDTKQ